ncbi:glycosyltransferase family 2 protein [Rhizobium aouanii]|uniref:Glycosyltransferase family 2 protein n=1 Tax=Rhizobium aouanii TaxID=3118145 RepID=A0ABU8CV81_9HYPH
MSAIEALESSHSSMPVQGPMFNLPRTSLVIPTLNEAENIKLLLPRIPTWVHEIIIVDGRSTDGTPDIARSMRNDVKIVLQPKKGKGIALRTGFEAASGDMIVMLDADGSMDPYEIILFVAALVAGADFVKGSRFMQGGGTSDMTVIRRFGNLGLTLLVRMLYGSSFSDLCYGYMGFWRRHVPLLRADCDGFEIETLINLRALKNKLKIMEVASFESERIYGVSNLRALPDGWRVLKTIFRERVSTPTGVQVLEPGIS